MKPCTAVAMQGLGELAILLGIAFLVYYIREKAKNLAQKEPEGFDKHNGADSRPIRQS
jgi:hypothetical protein